MDAMDLLNEKLDQLIKKYTATVADNKRLRATIDGQNKVIRSLNKKVSALEGSVATVRLNDAVSTNEEKEDMRKQLDAVIGEIDKILVALND
jgi:vacuolar-type H+-ATPase subunit D/Vma8